MLATSEPPSEGQQSLLDWRKDRNPESCDSATLDGQGHTCEEAGVATIPTSIELFAIFLGGNEGSGLWYC